MQKLTDTVIAYKLVWFRVTCYFLIPSVNTFLALTETWGGQTWETTHPFLVVRLFAQCALNGIVAFVAFIDTAMGKAKDDMKEMKASRETEFFEKQKLEHKP